MNIEDTSAMLDLLRSLWPDWNPNDAEAKLWGDKLRWAPHYGVVEWAIKEHRAKARWKAPVLADVRGMVNAEYERRKATLAHASIEREANAEHERRVVDDRRKAFEWAAKRTDDELISIAERVSRFAGTLGAQLPIGKRPGMSREEHAAALRKPVAALILCAGVSAMRERQAAGVTA